MASTTYGAAWVQGRLSHDVVQKQRKSILLTIVSFFAKRLPRWKKFRTTVMQVTGFGFIDFGVFQASHLWGYIAIGVSLIVLDLVSGGDS